ncbi:MAG: hypothetical protein KAW94_01555 [Candidatus Thorarchaeota archaeon]|nr:hypothetical protein [Candidatus Thorarchaeota archaeon]
MTTITAAPIPRNKIIVSDNGIAPVGVVGAVDVVGRHGWMTLIRIVKERVFP